MDNNGKHISSLLVLTTCKKHKAREGDPCWYINLVSSNQVSSAVCGPRIKSAGYTGKISPSSMRTKSPSGGRTGGYKS